MSSSSLLSKKPSGLFPNNNNNNLLSSNSQYSQNLKMSLKDSSELKENESDMRRKHEREISNLKDEFNDQILELKRKNKV